MNLFEIAGLFTAAAAAGGINAVAGGGTFIIFPALMMSGLSPISANATATVAVWPGSVASALGFRGQLVMERRRLVPLMAISLAGGGAGALILLLTPEATFRAMVPWLLLAATLIFTFGQRGMAWLQARLPHSDTVDRTRAALSFALQFAIAVYGGYFGAGVGILMLAMLQMMGLTHMHQMNAVKALLGTMINAVAVVIFICAGIVAWPRALLMMAGAVTGGYAGARLSQRLPQRAVRQCVSAIGFALTAYYFLP